VRRTLAPLLVALGVFVVLQALMLTGLLNLYWQQVVNYAVVVTISALGLNLIYGFTGQFSLGHAAFFGIGAYTAAFITRVWASGGYLAFAAGLIAGTILAGLVAFAIGLPILRLRSDYLGIATLGFGIIMKVVFDNLDFLGGSRGMSGIAGHTNFAVVFAVGIAGVIVLRNLIYSSIGRALLSIREDEIAAEAIGVNTTRFKTLGFVVGCCYAGIAGGLYAHLYKFLHPSNFDFLKSIDVLLVVVLGGLGSMSGTVIAAVAWTFLLEGLRVILPPEILDWRLVIYPLLLIVVMLLRPKGLFGGREFRFLVPKETKSGEANCRPTPTGADEAQVTSDGK
jgi:branched-chain amino acid transport system permease protein